MSERPAADILFGEGNDRRCRECGLKTNPTVPESAWDGLCGLCRAGWTTSYPAAVIAVMGDWAARMRRLVPFGEGRGCGDAG